MAEGKVNDIAVVRIRGHVGVQKDIEDTLFMLRLRKKHACVVIPGTKSNLGMLQKVKDFVTYGVVDEATKKALADKQKEEPCVHLHPPRGGFERKGIKKAFAAGGALGDRKEAMSALINRMLN